MNRADFLASTAAALAVPGAAQTDQVPGGRTFVVSLRSAPYPHASRANGHTYQGKMYDAATHYSDSSVGIFVPDTWRPGGATDAVVHFYGWNHDVAATFQTYRLREQFVASARNAILVVPEGPTNAPDSGDGKLELDEGGFARFMAGVGAWMVRAGLASSAQIGRIVLTAHSGGYGGAGGALARGGMNARITDVILFDAAYAYFDAFAGWAKGAGKHLLSVFTDDTCSGNTALMGMLQGASPNLYVWLAGDLTPARLKTRAATFVQANGVAHDDLLTHNDWYTTFLQSTALSRT